MNDAMSLGIHRCWKAQFVDDIGILRGNPVNQIQSEKSEISEKNSSIRHLDMACGTGDIALKVIENQKKQFSIIPSLPLKTTCMDINAEMISEGQKRFSTLGFSQDEVEFLQGNAEQNMHSTVG